MKARSACPTLALRLLAGCATSSRHAGQSFPEPSSLPAVAEMPAALTFFDGRPVRSRQGWVQERRPEPQTPFPPYIYGAPPPQPPPEEVRPGLWAPNFSAA